jgi:UDP:flavonoid glycosyltransferase YjiC (YdhE family)
MINSIFSKLKILKTHYPQVIFNNKVGRREIVFVQHRPATWVALSDISQAAIAAIQITEDRYFYSHSGLDIEEIKLALFESAKVGYFTKGASTITQQVVKNIYLSMDKKFSRKIGEMILSLILEKILNKQEILEIYLNIIEFGEGLYGIGPAAKLYFDKHPGELSVKEGAFLAMLLPSPSKYSQCFREQILTGYARKTINRILLTMRSFNKIDEETYHRAKNERFSWQKLSESNIKLGIDIGPIRDRNMATIVIASTGSLDDQLPYIALGQALKERGHRVVMAINPTMYPYALKADLEVFPDRSEVLGSEQALQQEKARNHWWPFSRATRECHNFLEIELRHGFRSILAVCKGADLLISSSQQDTIGAMVHEKTGISWISVSVIPFLLSHPLLGQQKNPQRDIVDFYELCQKIRRQEGLAKLPQNFWMTDRKSELSILASSSYFSQPYSLGDFLYSEHCQLYQTGFWFYEDPERSNWQPTQEVRSFVEQQPQPLVLFFSSLSVENPSDAIAVHARAAALLNRRLVVRQDWANCDKQDLPADLNHEQILFIDFLPPDWLFSRAGAVIHHGEIGTIARALRNDCPMLIEPCGNDQFFNAGRVLALGVGAAMDPQKLTAEELALVLETKILSPNVKKNAATLGAQIRAERGIENACDLIAGWLS